MAYDAEKDIWIIKGHTEKSNFDRRANLYVTVYNMDGSTHSTMEFTDTKQGAFYTQWIAPTEPGLYVSMLQYQNSKATQIVHVEEEFDYKYTKSDLNMVDLAREFEELESFAEKFGGQNFEENHKGIEIIGACSVNGFFFDSIPLQGFEPGPYNTALENFKRKIDHKLEREQ